MATVQADSKNNGTRAEPHNGLSRVSCMVSSHDISSTTHTAVASVSINLLNTMQISAAIAEIMRQKYPSPKFLHWWVKLAACHVNLWLKL